MVFAWLAMAIAVLGAILAVATLVNLWRWLRGGGDVFGFVVPGAVVAILLGMALVIHLGR